MKCYNCNNEDLLDSDKVCSNCGAIVNKEMETKTQEDNKDDIAKKQEDFKEETKLESPEIEVTAKEETLENINVMDKSYQELEKLANELDGKSESGETMDDSKEPEKLEDSTLSENKDSDVDTKGKSNLKFKFQLGAFVAGILFLLFGVIYTINISNTSDGEILLIYDGSSLKSVEFGSDKAVTLTDDASEVAISFAQKDNNGNIYFPVSMEDNSRGLPEYSLTKYDGKNSENIISNAEGLIIPNSNGKSILNFKDVDSQYDKIMGDLYVYDYTSNTLIEKDVNIITVDVSNNGKYALFTKDETNDLYIYDFKSKSTKKIDEGIEDIKYIDDKYEDIIYTKAGKEIEGLQVSSLYSAGFNKKPKVITSNVFYGEVVIIDDKFIYTKPIEKIPSYKEVKELLQLQEISDFEVTEEIWKQFYMMGFFQLWEMNLDGSDNNLIKEKISKIDFISRDADVIVYSAIKDMESLDMKDKNIAELMDGKNFVKKIYIGDGVSIDFPAEHQNVLENSNYLGKFAFDENSKLLYYIYNGNLYSININATEIIAELVEENVDYVLFDDTLVFSKLVEDNATITEGTEEASGNLSELYLMKNKEKILIDENIDINSVVLTEDVFAYFKSTDKGLTINRVINGVSKELDLVSSTTSIARNGDFYYINDKNKLMMSKKNKAVSVADNVTNIRILENNSN